MTTICQTFIIILLSTISVNLLRKEGNFKRHKRGLSIVNCSLHTNENIKHDCVDYYFWGLISNLRNLVRILLLFRDNFWFNSNLRKCWVKHSKEVFVLLNKMSMCHKRYKQKKQLRIVVVVVVIVVDSPKKTNNWKQRRRWRRRNNI